METRWVDGVHDGDTFSVKLPIWHHGKSFTKIRLANFYAPELGEDGGVEAKSSLATLVFHKMVELEVKGVSYDRLVCNVYLKGVNIVDTLRISSMLRRG